MKENLICKLKIWCRIKSKLLKGINSSTKSLNLLTILIPRPNFRTKIRERLNLSTIHKITPATNQENPKDPINFPTWDNLLKQDSNLFNMKKRNNKEMNRKRSQHKNLNKDLVQLKIQIWSRDTRLKNCRQQFSQSKVEEDQTRKLRDKVLLKDLRNYWYLQKMLYLRVLRMNLWRLW